MSVNWKKLAMASMLCCAVVCSPTYVFAQETDTQLEGFNVSNDYSDDFMKDAESTVYYQQGTGLNTLNKTVFEYHGEYSGLDRVVDEKDSLNVTILENPASNPEFLKTPCDFDITLNVRIDEDGVITEKKVKIPAKVVEIEGKIISGRAKEPRDIYYISYKNSEDENREFSDALFEQYQNYTYSVQLNDGSIIEAKTELGLMGAGTAYGGSFGGSGYYDMKYEVEYNDDMSKEELEYYKSNPIIYRGATYYYIDENDNLVLGGGVSIEAKDRVSAVYESELEGLVLEAKEGNLLDNAVLKGSAVTDLDLGVQPYVAYNLSVYAGDKVIQPKGKVNVTLPLSKELMGINKIRVYHVDENNKYTEVPSHYDDTTVTFETDHFSTYVATEELTLKSDGTPDLPDIPWIDLEPSTPVEDEKEVPWTPIEPAQPVDKEEEKGESSDTSDSSMVTLYASAAILSGAILILSAIKKAKKC